MEDETENEMLLFDDSLCRCSCANRHNRVRSKPRFSKIITFVLLLLISISEGIQMLRQQQTAALLSTGQTLCQQSEWVNLVGYGQDKRYQSLSHDYDFLWDIEASAQNGVIKLGMNDVTGEMQVGSIGM